MGMIPNVKKINQDSSIIVKDLAGVKGLWMFGVMDGHGVNGHLVSELVRKNLPGILSNLINGGNGLKYSSNDFQGNRKSLGIGK
jgi:serine/threonine protein phosphatase PrpC